MRVGVGGLAVGRPARVADADGCGERFLAFERGDELLNFALALDDRDGAVRERDARRVVPPILQVLQPADEHVAGVVLTVAADVADDATHQRRTSAPAETLASSVAPEWTSASGPTSVPGATVTPPPSRARSATTAPSRWSSSTRSSIRTSAGPPIALVPGPIRAPWPSTQSTSVAFAPTRASLSSTVFSRTAFAPTVAFRPTATFGPSTAPASTTESPATTTGDWSTALSWTRADAAMPVAGSSLPGTTSCSNSSRASVRMSQG